MITGALQLYKAIVEMICIVKFVQKALLYVKRQFILYAGAQTK